MRKLLVVVDMQNDFIDGALGTKEAQAIVPNVVEKIKNWDGDIAVTRDTHFDNYLNTREGRYLPVKHCIDGDNGWQLNADIDDAIFSKAYNQTHFIEKSQFGSFALVDWVNKMGYDYVELIGLCTDICVVSNALLIKNALPELDIAVDSKCCAGVTPESHDAALLTMKMCQIDIL